MRMRIRTAAFTAWIGGGLTAMAAEATMLPHFTARIALISFVCYAVGSLFLAHQLTNEH